LPNDGRLVAQYTKDGNTVLVVADVGIGKTKVENVHEYSGAKDGLPRMFGGIVSSSDNNILYFLGGSPSVPTSIYKWNLDTRSPASVLACSSNLTFPDDVISEPEQIEFPTTLGTAYGYYYAPKNGGFRCTTEDAPPLLVKAHGKEDSIFRSLCEI
jgi:dipeptidyl aminopeptidase/acylaminoacyl peptidase